ncbi:hypothetical protein CH352_13520 [Leptospira hartskeerlii]|uniref:Uncharacterized protein n=1 Tax=Leptospira hartskeerlii TaxID=2023177 RepID=A0A2M9XAB8_9LEPT|nr:hypothetical protein [Leptospira hartskeerlii]PJZ24559.1 hypothetical protein CH357_15985 [Leptospira hartskeerlii]PJZ32828.1 hypothetical protein CH352_13520 [Leptospira hartskeerlii]
MKNPRIKVNFNRRAQGATRFFQDIVHFRTFLFSIFLVSGLVSCASTQRFDQLRKVKEDKALLYVLRPQREAQSLFSFAVELYKYPGSFKEGNRTLFQNFGLDSGEYKILELASGFYALKCRDFEKVFFAKEGKIIFLSIELFNTGTFTLPDLFIQEPKPEDALRYLLEGKRMYWTPSEN